MTDDQPRADDPSPTSPTAAEGGAEVRKGRIRPAAIGFALAVVAAAAFGLYGMARQSGKHVAHSGACARSLDLAESLDPLVRGEVAALSLAEHANPLAPIAFDDADGRKTTIASFQGKSILLNLWATWCVPCRTEMPSLDKLQGELGSDTFAVVPVNIDTVRLEKARAFLKEIDAKNLPYYSDSSADILQQLKQNERIVGLPTTVLIGKDGCEVGTMAGPAQWDSPDAKALIRKLEATPAAS